MAGSLLAMERAESPTKPSDDFQEVGKRLELEQGREYYFAPSVARIEMAKDGRFVVGQGYGTVVQFRWVGESGVIDSPDYLRGGQIKRAA